jgi:hypothetical protein
MAIKTPSKKNTSTQALSEEFATQVLETRKIGVIDLTGSQKSVHENLKDAGFKKIAFLKKFDSKNQNRFYSEHDFYVVIGSNAHRVHFSKINRRLLKQAKNYLLLQLDAFGGVLGPTLGLQGGPCFECLLKHPTSCFKDSFDRKKDLALTKKYIQKGLFHFLSVELMKITSLVARPHTFDGFYQFDLFNFRMAYHRVGPSPHCLCCQDKK